MTDARSSELTPMMQQYQELKRRYPDYLLLFRLGDFYEMFAEDARVGARLLQITLTARQATPMAGIPHHAADTYIAKLIRQGQKVAVCEQMEAPGRGKKLVRREVVRLITPGTLTDTQMLDGAASNYLLAVHRDSGREGGRGHGTLGIALAEVSTGEFWAGEEAGAGDALLEAALLRRPAEILVSSDGDEALGRLLAARGVPLTVGDSEWFRREPARERLRAHFSGESLEGFGVGGLGAGLQAAGAALAYLRETQGDRLGHLTRLLRFSGGDALALDQVAVATLELFETAQERAVKGSLIGLLDGTRTPMGARALRQWLLRPLREVGAITERQEAVGALAAGPEARDALRARLGGIGDIERLASRAALGAAHARDLVGLRASLRALPALREALAPVSAPLCAGLAGEVAALPELARLLEEALEDEPPRELHEGGLIREAWSAELAELRRAARDAKAWIATLEGRERARTGIPSLRVRFNRVFGYSIEVSHAHAAKIPADYVRRQTLVGAERYVTTELKEYESRALGAEERMAALEFELFVEIRARVAAQAEALLRTARAVAALDALAALAELAHLHGWVRPVVDESRVLEVAGGRHPVIEAAGAGAFTPNDVALDPDTSQIVILTGPNMSGKSVFMRQTALLVILAQMGSFIPAVAARIGLVDRILTRVGAQDNVTRGQSTFLVEMVETASILHNATARSLVLLDEVGRGTSTLDGLAIAWAVTEALHESAPRAKVLFATHYHELTALADRLPRVRNFHVAVREWNDEIIFLHTVRPGGTDRSYGIQVARLAGLPAAVVARAKAILGELESERAALTAAGAPPTSAAVGSAPVQLGLFPPGGDPILKDIAALDIGTMTPLAALNLLAEWQRVLRERPA